jgi:hypothetical protein
MVFTIASGMQPALAYSLYYSIRGFDGRIGLFKATIPHSKLPKKYNSVLRAFANKARALSAHRNALAHDQFVLDMNRNSSTFGSMLISDGKFQFQSDEIKTEGRQYALTATDIRKISKLFVRLDNQLSSFWADHFTGPAQQPSKYSARVRAIHVLKVPKPISRTPSKHPHTRK